MQMKNDMFALISSRKKAYQNYLLAISDMSDSRLQYATEIIFTNK